MGGVPRSVNGLNIYTFDLDCMFATVLYFPWVLHCFPRFSFVLIPFLTYVIILSWVCTAHFASRAICDFSPYGQNVAELRGEAWTTILGRKQFRLLRGHMTTVHTKKRVLFIYNRWEQTCAVLRWATKGGFTELGIELFTMPQYIVGSIFGYRSYKIVEFTLKRSI